ncbi:MAG TPA: response regulator, partial [Gammaproteobacteria bacterium]|nr:response regulator [Gammaproteobacteria bacterium]
MKLRFQILLLLILLGWVPLAIFGFFTDINTRFDLKAQALDHLSEIRDLKVLQIENYLRQTKQHAKTLSRSPFVVENMHRLPQDFAQTSIEELLQHYIYKNPHRSDDRDLLVDPGDGSPYSQRHRTLHPTLVEYVNDFGFYDLYLIDPSGNILYTAQKESDFVGNLNQGGLQKSQLKSVYDQAMKAQHRDKAYLSHVEPYLPSNLKQAGFVSSSIDGQNGERLGVLVLQYSVHPINEIINNLEGLHPESKVILGQLQGEQILFLNQTMFDWSKQAQFLKFQQQALSGEIESPMVLALKGETGARLTQNVMAGEAMFAAWEPIGDLGWGGVVIYVSESLLLSEVNQDRQVTIWVLAGLLVLIFWVAWIESAFLSRPIHRLLRGIAKVKDEDFAVGINTVRSDELGDLNRAFVEMAAELDKNSRERAQIQQALEASALQADEANKAKDDFLAAMSHELRTPLTSIIGNSELLATSLLSEEQRELLLSVEFSSRGLLSLINDILDLSKIESGKFEIDEGSYDLEQMIDEVARIFKVRAAESDISFNVDFTEKLTHQVEGDGRRIGQVLINLLGNAFKFTSSGAVSLKIWADHRLHFRVEDSGIGMSVEVLNRLFQPFEQADRSISRRFGGTGLGLHISMTLAQMMEGDIEVSSEEGVGSCFQLNLPYQIDRESRVERDQEAVDSVSQRFVGEVLVAEDTVELQVLVRKMLASVGVKVTLVNNGQEALEQVLHQSYPLLLMDMQMPVMDGIEATRRLRAVGYHAPIVAMTANVMQQHRDQFKEAGCDDFLSKPIDRRALNQVLSQYLQRETPVGSPQEEQPVE